MNSSAKFQHDNPPYGFWGDGFLIFFGGKFSLSVAISTNQI